MSIFLLSIIKSPNDNYQCQLFLVYFAGSIGVTAATASAVFRTPALFNIVARSGWIALGVSLAAMIGSGMLVRSIPYQEGFGAKQMAW